VTVIGKLKVRARSLKADTYALYLAARHPETPWYAKLFIACVVGYAFSPLDLIPDFVPVLGYLDDLILLPLGITLAIKMMPAPVLAECRTKANELVNSGVPVSRIAVAVIILVWVFAATLCIVWSYRAFK
jgi:uncharacterized membrane protein YkvA (DUF1232 family)